MLRDRTVSLYNIQLPCFNVVPKNSHIEKYKKEISFVSQE